MSPEPAKFTEVMAKRLLKATPKGRKRLIVADNPRIRCISRSKSITKLACSSPILLGWFESFALQNLQAFSKYEEKNVYTIHYTLYSKLKFNFIVRICLYSFMNEFKVLSVFRPFKCLSFINHIYTDIVY